jgi:class 3 adenylate cyclase
MKIPVDHQKGQYRAELFEELMALLLSAEFPNAEVRRNYVLPKRVSGDELGTFTVDFLVTTADQTTLVETRSPYSDKASLGINRALRRLKGALTRFPDTVRVDSIILVIASELPAASAEELSRAKEYFKEHGVNFRLWDAVALSSSLSKYLDVRISSFSIENLESVLAALSKEKIKESSQTSEPPPPTRDIEIFSPVQKLGEGDREDVVVLVADFCSYSRFVQASGDDRDLVVSIMGRFYRETRKIVDAANGLLDKFMGDGALAFWLPGGSAADNFAGVFDPCISDLIGNSLNLAKEWQDQIDYAVSPIGMRVGAALGRVLFIPEQPKDGAPIHAIGDAINLAARLQGKSEPNALLVANRLKKAYFDTDPAFVEIPPLPLKNMGDVMAWKKDYAPE